MTTEFAEGWIGTGAQGRLQASGVPRRLCVRRIGMRPTAHREGAGDAWLGGGVSGNGGEAGDARGADGEATGGDHQGAAPSGTAMPMSWPDRKSVV